MNITRQQQLLANIKRIVSTELIELNHELFHSVVVTYVHLSNDGRECKIFVVTSPENLKELNGEYRLQIQRAFMKKYARKIVPKLEFVADNGEVEQLEKILAEETTNE